MNTDALYEYIKTLEGRIAVLEGGATGDVNIDGDLWLENNKFVRTKSADGTKTGSVIGVNSANNVVVGYIGYNNEIGNTYLEGNEVRLLSKGDVKASFSDGTSYCVGTRASLVMSSHTTSTATLNGNSSSGAKTQTFTKAGYYPLGIVGYQCNGSYGQHVVPSNVHISSQGSGTVTVSYTLKNTSSSNSTNTGITVYILWIKE